MPEPSAQTKTVAAASKGRDAWWVVVVGVERDVSRLKPVTPSGWNHAVEPPDKIQVGVPCG